MLNFETSEDGLLCETTTRVTVSLMDCCAATLSFMDLLFMFLPGAAESHATSSGEIQFRTSYQTGLNFLNRPSPNTDTHCCVVLSWIKSISVMSCCVRVSLESLRY